MSSKCLNTTRELGCFNSYQDSLYIGPQSHYTCPLTCVSLLEDMCRGVNWCGSDVQECGPQLRCSDTPKSLNSSLAKEHRYCINLKNDESNGAFAVTQVLNDGKFDALDRSDEQSIFTSEGTSYDIDNTTFELCTHFSSPGLTCGTKCKWSRYWCNDGSSNQCQSAANTVSSQDRRLCGNPLVFKKLDCISYWPNGVRWYGKKCIGTNQRCIVPWYTQATQTWGDGSLSETCSDKSDQIFSANLTCRDHLQKIIDFHDSKFCQGSQDQFKLMCTNKTLWLSRQDPTFSDPHNCQASCSSPGLDCVACSNPEYFPCSSSNTCLHPLLECDGHPQCPGGEDEDLDKCQDKYRKKQVIEPFASYRCTSKLYENLEIYATPCNDKTECADGSDEAGCKKNSTSNTVIIVAMFTIFVMFVVLRCFRTGLKEKSCTDTSDLIIPKSTKELVEKYENDINDNDMVQEVNLYLLHSLYTKTVKENKERLFMIFDFLASKHNYNEAELYKYFHKNIDPRLVQKMQDAKYPGCKDGIVKVIEKVARRPFTSEISDCINNSENAKKILQNTTAITKIEVKFLDIIKDLALSILMLELVGGLQAIIDLPTNFGSVIVVVMFGSIFIPMLISSLHYAVNNFDMFLPEVKNSSKTRRYLKTALLFILSPVQQLLLETHHLQTAEEARELAQNYNIEAIQKKYQSRNIQKQMTSFGRIELGNFINSMRQTLDFHAFAFLIMILKNK